MKNGGMENGLKLFASKLYNKFVAIKKKTYFRGLLRANAYVCVHGLLRANAYVCLLSSSFFLSHYVFVSHHLNLCISVLSLCVRLSSFLSLIMPLCILRSLSLSL